MHSLSLTQAGMGTKQTHFAMALIMKSEQMSEPAKH